MKKERKQRYLAFGLLLIFAFVQIAFIQVNASNYRQTQAMVSEDIVIKVNGETMPFKAVISDAKTYLPVRLLGRALNADVKWVDATRKIEVTPLKNPIQFERLTDLETIKGSKTAYFMDDISFVLGTATSENAGKFTATYQEMPEISKQIIVIDSRSYLPVRAITEQTSIRVQWDEEKREIRIVNPNTVSIGTLHKDYYISDLPKIQKEEDYLVGNWKGKDTFVTNSYRGVSSVIHLTTDSYFYISKQPNGLYQVYQTNIFNDVQYPNWNGTGYKILWKDVIFNSETKELMLRENQGKCFESTCPDLSAAGIYASNIGPVLKGDSLSADYGKKHTDRTRYSFYERF